MQGFSIKSILIWDSNSKMEPYLSIISLLRDKNKILLQLSFLNNMAYLSRVFLVLLQLYRKWCSNKASFCRADVLLKVAQSQNIFPSSKKCAKSQILNFFSIQVKNFRILIWHILWTMENFQRLMPCPFTGIRKNSTWSQL